MDNQYANLMSEAHQRTLEEGSTGLPWDDRSDAQRDKDMYGNASASQRELIDKGKMTRAETSAEEISQTTSPQQPEVPNWDDRTDSERDEALYGKGASLAQRDAIDRGKLTREEAERDNKKR